MFPSGLNIVSLKVIFKLNTALYGMTSLTFNFLDLLIALIGLSTRRTLNDLMVSLADLSGPMWLMNNKEKYDESRRPFTMHYSARISNNI